MTKNAIGRTGWALAALALAGAGIAGTAVPAQEGHFRIEGCSLACASGPTQVTCGTVNVHVNEEFRIAFTEAVDLSSVKANPSTFRILDVSNGQSPPGTYRLDPEDRSALVFEPQLSFSPLGVPQFGLSSNATYQLFIPGFLAGDPPPYVLSQHGRPVENRLLCTVVADQGVRDYVHGWPTYAASVDVVRTCVPGGAVQSAPAGGAQCVALDSKITLVFDDVMNVGTVVIPILGWAPYIGVSYADASDVIAGSWSISVDVQAKTTTAVFAPSAPLDQGRWIMLRLTPQVTDMVGNPLTGPKLLQFSTVGA